MKRFYITGTSRGIGKALAALILQDENSEVIGLSRGCDIDHPRYRHIAIDLNDLDAVKNFEFEFSASSDGVYLINNAGYLGEVGVVGSRSNDDVIRSFNVNAVAPAVLMNSFIQNSESINGEKVILNISSGAGRNAYDSWATYCSGKAALDMYSQVIGVEQCRMANEKNPVRIYSVAPGIVDTQMQDEIREFDASNFPLADKFADYKKSGALSSPDIIAEGLLAILKYPENFHQVILDLRDMGIS